jgi:hypothetical protein
MCVAAILVSQQLESQSYYKTNNASKIWYHGNVHFAYSAAIIGINNQKFKKYPALLTSHLLENVRHTVTVVYTSKLAFCGYK